MCLIAILRIALNWEIAFNDIVFAFQPVGGRRVLNSADREYLKEKDLGYSAPSMFVSFLLYTNP